MKWAERFATKFNSGAGEADRDVKTDGKARTLWPCLGSKVKSAKFAQSNCILSNSSIDMAGTVERNVGVPVKSPYSATSGFVGSGYFESYP